MPYREQALDWVGSRVAQIAAEMNQLDEAIATWSTRFVDGTPAPPQVRALYERREALLIELRALHDRFR
jgi:hypothetical protein